MFRHRFTYLIQGNRVGKYRNRQLMPGYPRVLSEEFSGLPNNIYVDAALVWSANGQLYLFSGSNYWKYDWAERKIVPGYPLAIADR